MSCKNDKVVSGLIDPDDIRRVREAVCISTEKIYDSCKDKDCIENARVLFRYPGRVQCLLRRALNVKLEKAVVKKVLVDTDPLPFRDGYYTVDVTYIIKVWLEFLMPPGWCGPRCVKVPGWVIFDKKTVLFGSEGKVKIFRANDADEPNSCGAAAVEQDNSPITKVEVAEPLPLDARIVDVRRFSFNDNYTMDDLPNELEEDDTEAVAGINIDIDIDVDIDVNVNIPTERAVVVSLGLFSIIKLARMVQLLIPAFDFCVPNKVCIGAADNPCELFEAIDFPVDEFFPPQQFDFEG